MRRGRMFLLASLLLAVAPAPASAPVGFVVLKPSLVGGRYVELAQALARDGQLHALARDLNRVLVLPVSISVRYAECGEANATYDPRKREIRLCLELIEQLAEDFGERLDDDAELARAVAGANRFIVLHEIGHALVDVLELPITGREEDAVDQLSAWLLIGDAEGDLAVLSAAAAFSMVGDENDLGESNFADAHSLNHQRYFSMVCWVYGSAPQRHGDLPGDAGLPAMRAAECADEFGRLDRSWSRLMQPHLRR